MSEESPVLKFPHYFAVRKKTILGDIFFVIQIVAAVWFGFAQVGTLLVSVEGASITWMGFWFAFVMMNLGLAIGASRKVTDRVIKQAVANYFTWTLVIGLAFFTLLMQGASWNFIDSLTSIITGVGIFGLIVYARTSGLEIFDPIIRGGFALLFKFVPQMTLAVNVWLYGGSGIALYTIWVGHFIISMRIGQIWISARKTSWDRHRIGVVIGELGNEVSWIVVTIVWLLVLE